MEMKAMPFLLPFLLLVTIRFSTSVEALIPLCQLYPPSHCRNPSLEAVDTEAMAPPPVEPHSHPMIKAPTAPPPVEPHTHPMIKAPPAHSPEKPHPYHHAPAHSPEKPHYCHHGQGKAPCHDPEKHHYHHAPGKAPFHSPENHHYRHAHGPMHPPVVVREETPFPNRKPDCPERCGKYCKKDDHKKGKKEECVKACTVCCKKFECVPREHNKKCKWSSEVKMGGETVKCPR